MQPKIGITLSIQEGGPLSEAIELVQMCEDLGYDSIWSGESWGREVFTGLAHIACNTSKVRLGVGIANVYSRTPGLMAQSIASLDEISQGRAILGLGSSGEKVIRDWHGVPFSKPIQRTREYIDIVNLALSGHRVNYDGEFYKLRDFRLGFEAPREHVPIFLASLGPKNVALTGELADGWAPIYLSPNHLPRFRGQLNAGASSAGRHLDDIEVRPYVISAVSEDVQEARAAARRQVAFYVGGMGRYYRELIASYGYVEETDRVAVLWAQRDREGAADAVTDAILDELTIVGTAEECRQRVMDLNAAGMGWPAVYIPNGVPRRMVRETIEGLAPAAFR